MNTASQTIPFALAYAAPVRSPIRWVAGAVSVGMAVAAVGLSVVGKGLTDGGGLGDAWAAAMFAIVAVAAAATGLFCGAGAAIFGKGDRTLSMAGALCSMAAASAV